MTTTDTGTLAAVASKAQAALDAARRREAEAAEKAAAARREREINWAITAVATYPERLAEASAVADAALADFDRIVAEDYGSALAAYLVIVRLRATANREGERVAAARMILRRAGVLAPSRQPEPTGQSAPFPTVGGNAFPTFDALVASTVDALTRAASRIPPLDEDPGSFDREVSEGAREAVEAASWSLLDALELDLALSVQHPAHYEARISPERKVEVEAYRRGREARGYSEPLPLSALPLDWTSPAKHPTERERQEAARWGR